MKKSPPFKPGMFALGFLGAYSLAALILFFTLKESVAGSGTTPRSPAGPQIIADNPGLPPFETYSDNVAPENGEPFFVKADLSPNPSGPAFDGGLSDDATGSIFREGAPSPANAPPSSFEPNRNSGIGRANTPRLFGAGLFTAGFPGTSGTPPEDLTSIPTDPSGPLVGSPDPSIPSISTGPSDPIVDSPGLPSIPIDPSDPIIGSPDPGPQIVKRLADPPGPDDPKPPIVPPKPDPTPQNPDPSPAPIAVPEPLTLSIFATGMLGVFTARRGRKKAEN